MSWKRLRRKNQRPEDWTGPRRGDDTEAWLKRQRDMHIERSYPWDAIDELLDDYRLHADTGTPLSEHVPDPYDHWD